MSNQLFPFILSMTTPTTPTEQEKTNPVLAFFEAILLLISIIVGIFVGLISAIGYETIRAREDAFNQGYSEGLLACYHQQK